ncbi:hypothetical protein ACPPVS_01590 [Cellulomonas sp. McL0617]|uniref:hypothetical protein n=1 Tax=Cellulomonas sp. McL0617 TaxID=3415675 RepID=UPI003CF9CC4A
MTTYDTTYDTTTDDADLFSDAFTGFSGVAPSPRHSRLVTGLALSGAALVVVGALVGVRLAQQTPTASPVQPGILVPALAETQRAGDVIAADDRADLLISPDSTRLLLTDDTGSYYAATAPGNQLCLVSVPLGDLPQTSCTSTAGDLGTLRLDDVMLVPAGVTAPAGWHESSANVFVKD